MDGQPDQWDNVCPPFNGSINDDVTVRRVLATDYHVVPLSIDFGNERPPPEPPPILRPPPEPPPLSCRA